MRGRGQRNFPFLFASVSFADAYYVLRIIKIDTFILNGNFTFEIGSFMYRRFAKRTLQLEKVNFPGRLV